MQKTIYCFTNLVNNKRYIGSTIIAPNKRYNQHVYCAFHENAHQYNYPLYQAFRKYGLENFKYEILLQTDCTEEEIRKIERQYIIQYNTLSPNGYNQTLDTIHPLSDSTSYKKMSETKREKAKKVAEINEQQQIIKIWRSIVDCAEETQLSEKHIAACCRGERHSTQNRYFCWLDENGELLIPQFVGTQYKGKPGTTQNQKTNRKVKKIDLSTKEVLAIYDSLALAGRENNCDSSCISKVCKGQRSHCGGFYWEYAD